MNYLSHIFLAGNNEKLMIGSLLGDFIRKSDDVLFEKEILEGIHLHRKLDSFTDAHPIVLSSKKLFSDENRRYAGILLDIFYDHFLANHWSVYSSVPLEAFTTNFYQILENHPGYLPERLKNALPHMKSENLLLSYRELKGVEKSIFRVSRRLKRPAPHLSNAVHELTSNYAAFEKDFTSFFPDAIKYADVLKK